MAVGLLGGMVMPICECGSVPLAAACWEKASRPDRDHLHAGCAGDQSVVLLSTYVAFGGNLKMVISRLWWWLQRA